MAPRPQIIIQRYDERWPTEFAETAELLNRALGEVAVRVDHIGSTSVPGLAAKDVIDIQVSVDDLADSRIGDRLAAIGATATDITTDHVPSGAAGEASEWAKRYFRAPSSWRRTHLHVRQVGRANHRYPLLFRDYLRSSAPAAAAYAQVKIALSRLHPDDVTAYYAVKDPVCDLVIEAAEQWALLTNWSPPR